MMMKKKVLIIGATGLVGNAVMKYFGTKDDCSVIAVSRRKPAETFGARHVSVDLTNQEQCREVFGSMLDITHVVYTALFEKPNLISGWTDQEQIHTNALMLRNMLEPLEKASQTLRHVTLMQGAKAYGVHVKKIQNPAREGISEMHEQPNFYWLQEEYLKEKQKGKSWSWTIFRPAIIFGESIGSPMNVLTAFGVYAALLKEEGKPLHFPGGVETILVATDVDLLARAIAWAGETEKAKGEAFNITNGDVFVWSTIWKTIANTLGMEPGENVPLCLTEEIPKRETEWKYICEKYGLVSPGIKEFVGSSFEFADYYFSFGHKEMRYPPLYSDMKLHKAGFHEWEDTEEMFVKWFRLFQEKRLLPRP
ncbi:SDR family oxidoreductase [Neobacillus sp. OS1-2]|uniref:SDR family oxidoreductase n=1 Tax=Neobacillus sp. OS1-2 TaxID=3070680 RepID=UPI0027E0AB8E|nr:SDR family oxidoreductase [Neobacillus sp. OS1-2]WML39739.1 SDR family oxidoreductase [Neobacillus sp. OS1-2]